MKKTSSSSDNGLQAQGEATLSPALQKRRHLPSVLRFCLEQQSSEFSVRNVADGCDSPINTETIRDLFASLCSCNVLTQRQESPEKRSPYLYKMTEEGMKVAREFLEEFLNS